MSWLSHESQVMVPLDNNQVSTVSVLTAAGGGEALGELSQKNGTGSRGCKTTASSY